MAILNRYSTGNPVYRGGSNAPTRGKVNPLGYVEREMRSRLAAAALKRAKPKISAARTPAKPKAVAKPVAKPIVPVRPKPKTIISPTGQIQPAPVVPIRVAKPQLNNIDFSQIQELLSRAQLPVDDTAMDDQNILEGQRVDYLAQLANARARLEQDKTASYRTLDLQAPKAQQDLLEQNAGRGMAFSGGHATMLGDLNNEFANARSAIDQGYARGNQDLLLGENAFNRQYQTGSAAITRRLSEAAAARAGQLKLQEQLAGYMQPQPELEAPLEAVAAAPQRADTRVELARQMAAKGMSPQQIMAKLPGNLSLAAVLKILSGR